MNGEVAAVAGLVVVAVAGLVLCVLLAHLTFLTRGLRREVGSLRRELDTLRREEAARPPPPAPRLAPTTPPVARTVLLDGPADSAQRTSSAEPTVPDRVVVSATLGEPLIKVAALSHGVRQALREEKRAHLAYQVRREYRRRRRATRARARSRSAAQARAAR